MDWGRGCCARFLELRALRGPWGPSVTVSSGTPGTHTMASVSCGSRGEVQPRISPGDSGLHWGTHTRYCGRSSCAAACGDTGSASGDQPGDRPRIHTECAQSWWSPCFRGPSGHPNPNVPAPRSWAHGRGREEPVSSERAPAPRSGAARRGSANISIRSRGKRLNASTAPCLDRRGSRGSFISGCPAQPRSRQPELPELPPPLPALHQNAKRSAACPDIYRAAPGGAGEGGAAMKH